MMSRISVKTRASNLNASRRSTLLAGISGAAGMGPLQLPLAARANPAYRTEISKVLDNPNWPAQNPLTKEAFARYDESNDFLFYSAPRFVTHIDDSAIKALTTWYSEVFPKSGNKDVALLDICSSWISHYPEGYTAGKIVGLGMNEEELKRNKVLTEYTVKDLNEDPKLPYPDNTFDVVTNAVSVDYLTKPIEVFKEIHRVLKPGGIAAMSFSNRCFPTKAIAIWTATGDPDHSVPNGFTPPKCDDISPKPGLFGKSDPMYVVYARKAEQQRDM